MFAIILIFTVLQFKLADRWVDTRAGCARPAGRVGGTEQLATRRNLSLTFSARRWAPSARSVLRHVLLAGFGLLMLTPLLWMVSTSLKPDGLEFEYPPRLIPTTITFDNYERGLTILPFARYFLNSLIVTGLATAGNVLSASFVAFGFARLRFPERDRSSSRWPPDILF